MFYSTLLGIGLACAAYYLPSWRACVEPYAHSAIINHELPADQGGEEVMTIFIHGAMHVLFAVLSPPSVLSGNLPGNSWYEHAHARLRLTHEPPSYALRKIALGLNEFTRYINPMAPHIDDQYDTMYHVLKTTYYAMPQLPHNRRRRWFTFGWSALLNEPERAAAGKKLYDALIALKDEAMSRGVTARFELYAFSHGGQLALQLPAIRKHEDRCDFTIDTLIFAAAPLFRQNTRNLWATTSDKTTMFRHVWNLYSPGDFAQTIDKFSTPEHVCFQTIAETIPIPQQCQQTKIVEIALSIDNRFTIPHSAFFDMGIIDIKPRRIRRSHHYQDRYLQAQQFAEHLAPFPLIIIYPALLATAEDLMNRLDAEPYIHLTSNLTGTSDAIVISTTDSLTHGTTKRTVGLEGIKQERSALTKRIKPLRYQNLALADLLTSELSTAIATLFSS